MNTVTDKPRISYGELRWMQAFEKIKALGEQRAAREKAEAEDRERRRRIEEEERADHVGEPIPEMLFRVKKWLADGREVRIFTARVSHDGTWKREQQAMVARTAIEAWCLKHLEKVIPITNVKDYAMIELWDDRAVQVVQNTGRPVGKSTRGLE